MLKVFASPPSFFLICCIALSLFSSCAVNPVTGKKELNFMSEEREIEMGKQYDPSIVQQYGLYEDEALQKFIDTKGQEMAAISHRSHLNFEFKILDSDVINAFAVPGGYVYFTRGIMAHFNNEAEFAGVLGHEIGHVTARHSASQMAKSTLGQILFIGGLIVSPTFRAFAQEGQQLMQLMFLKYSRDNESQSDELGVAYSTQVGYDAKEMAGFFETLSNMRKGTAAENLPEFQSTHPNPENRQVRVGELAAAEQAKFPNQQFKINRNEYLKLIDGIVYGPDPKQGYVDNFVFYHPELLFRYNIPRNWKTLNSPTQVQMAPEDGKGLMILTLGQGSNPQEAANAFVEQYKLTLVSQENTSVNGLPAYSIMSDQTNQQTGETIRILSYFIQYKELIYAFHGMAATADFGRYVGAYRGSMTSFNKLNDPKRINVKADRIKIISVPNNGSLQTVLQQQKIPSEKHQEHALINGMKLNDNLTKGSLLKIIAKG